MRRSLLAQLMPDFTRRRTSLQTVSTCTFVISGNIGRETNSCAHDSHCTPASGAKRGERVTLVVQFIDGRRGLPIATLNDSSNDKDNRAHGPRESSVDKRRLKRLREPGTASIPLQGKRLRESREPESSFGPFLKRLGKRMAISD